MSDVEHARPQHVPLLGLLETATEAVLAEFRRDLEATVYDDIRPTHGCVFRFVRDDGMRLTKLASLAGMTKQSVGEVVDDLVELGYVERIPDPVDRRAKLICLTERGVKAQGTGFGLLADLEERWGERYGPERLAQLRETLEDILARETPGRVPELAHREPAGVK